MTFGVSAQNEAPNLSNSPALRREKKLCDPKKAQKNPITIMDNKPKYCFGPPKKKSKD